MMKDIGEYLVWLVKMYSAEQIEIRKSTVGGAEEFISFNPIDDNGLSLIQDTEFDIRVATGFEEPNGRGAVKEEAFELFQAGAFGIERLVHALGKPDGAEIIEEYYERQGINQAMETLGQVQQIARNLEEHGLRLDASEAYLLTDGYSVYYALSDDEVVDVLKHRRQMLLLVPIHEQVAKLREVA